MPPPPAAGKRCVYRGRHRAEIQLRSAPSGLATGTGLCFLAGPWLQRGRNPARYDHQLHSHLYSFYDKGAPHGWAGPLLWHERTFHNVIMADRKKLKSANGMYLGSTGSGKSFAAKRELLNVFLTIPQDRIIVVDPMGEYAPLVRRLGGQVIEIAPDSPHHISIRWMYSSIWPPEKARFP